MLMLQGIIFVVIVTASALLAKGETKDEPKPAAEKLPLITSEVQRNSKDVSGEFTIKVTSANTTDAPISLRLLSPIIPAEFHRRPTSSTTASQHVDLNGQKLPPAQKITKRIPVPPASVVGTLFFVASTWETGATLSYDLEDVNQQTREIEATVATDWQGSFWGKLFGGMIGCAALAVFLSSRQIANPIEKTANKAYAFLSSFVSTFAVGVATVLAATLLIAFLSPGSLPITFSVDDWRGGALLGLFSVPIGGWLLDKLSQKNLTEDGTKKSAEPNTTKAPGARNV